MNALNYTDWLLLVVCIVYVACHVMNVENSIYENDVNIRGHIDTIETHVDFALEEDHWCSGNREYDTPLEEGCTRLDPCCYNCIDHIEINSKTCLIEELPSIFSMVKNKENVEHLIKDIYYHMRDCVRKNNPRADSLSYEFGKMADEKTDIFLLPTTRLNTLLRPWLRDVYFENDDNDKGTDMYAYDCMLGTCIGIPSSGAMRFECEEDDCQNDPLRKLAELKKISIGRKEGVERYLTKRQLLEKILYEQAASENVENILSHIESDMETKIDMSGDKGCVIYTVEMYIDEIIIALRNKYPEPYWAIGYYDIFSGIRDNENYDSYESKYRIILQWNVVDKVSSIEMINDISQGANILVSLKKLMFNEKSIYIEPLRCQSGGWIPISRPIYDMYWTRDFWNDEMEISKFLDIYCEKDDSSRYVCDSDRFIEENS